MTKEDVILTLHLLGGCATRPQLAFRFRDVEARMLDDAISALLKLGLLNQRGAGFYLT